MEIIWLTGMSGSGKTTLAKRLQEDWPCIILDGDEMRSSISLGAGFSRADRTEHNFRVASLAKVLSKQANVVVSVIAPIAEVRKDIDKICSPKWVYVKRTLPKREGHFYEEPTDYPIVDTDKLSIEKSLALLKMYIGIEKKETYSLFIGRWQPLHDGHLALFDKVRQEGKNILVGIRDTKIDKNNPLTAHQRLEMIQEKVPYAKVIVMPDIEEIVHGRKVGWGIRQIRLDEDLENISATKIRERENESS